MNSNKLTDVVACGGLFSCYLPQVEVLNGYLTLALTFASLAWILYKFLEEVRKRGRKE